MFEIQVILLLQTVIYSFTSPQTIGVSNGGGAEFSLSAELPVGAITQLAIEAKATDPEIAICRVYVKSAGANIPCVSNDVTEIQTKYASGGGNSEISFTLPSVTNSGKHKTSFTKTGRFHLR